MCGVMAIYYVLIIVQKCVLQIFLDSVKTAIMWLELFTCAVLKTDFGASDGKTVRAPAMEPVCSNLNEYSIFIYQFENFL